DRIGLAFSADPWLRDEPLEAEVRRGIVRLEGTVGSDAARRRAAAVAARIGGVRLVDDRLALRTRDGAVPHDAELEEDVESELYWSPFVDSSGIEVDVLDGVVTLSGVARTWAEIRAAERNAREAGARHVRNRLTVDHAPTREPGRAPLDEG
ncbi:MAG: BON domain-containing protein, partial [Planctomycetota bacterium JB042]